MINLKLFQRFLKQTGFANTLRRKHYLEKLFQLTINSDIDKICSLAPEYIVPFKQKIDTKFWLHAFDAWYHVLSAQQIVTSEHFHRTPSWYNSKISEEVLYLPCWYAEAITLISDL